MNWSKRQWRRIGRSSRCAEPQRCRKSIEGRRWCKWSIFRNKGWDRLKRQRDRKLKLRWPKKRKKKNNEKGSLKKNYPRSNTRKRTTYSQRSRKRNILSKKPKGRREKKSKEEDVKKKRTERSMKRTWYNFKWKSREKRRWLWKGCKSKMPNSVTAKMKNELQRNRCFKSRRALAWERKRS